MCRRKREWYFNTLTYCHKELIRLSIDRYGFVPKYIQYMLLYELQWRIYKHNITDDTLSREDKLEYRSLISDILKAIDDDVIYRLKNRTLPFKAYLYKLKYGKNILAEAEIIDNKFLYYKGNRVYNFKLPRRLVIKILEIKDNKLILDGHTDLISVGEKYKLYAEDNNEILYPVELSRREYKDSFSFCDEMILRAMAFKVEIPLSDIKSVKFVLIRDDGEKIKLTPGLGIFSGMTETMKSTYRNIDNKYIIKYINNELRIYPYRKKMHIASEHRFLKELKSLDKDYIVKDRLKYYILKLFYRKPIWIVRDRFEKAGDNGESVFKYLSKWEDKSKYNIVFLLKKNSKDYNRLCKYGKVLDPDSNKYKFYFLLSSKIIDSIVTLSSINPFDKDRKYYSNLLSFDYVALFHGIGQRDMSDWTNKYNYNIKLYVSGAKREYEAMLKENNGYDENIIKLTGLPRFDDLENNNSKTLIFMPTWRNDIAGPIIPGTTQRKFVESFKNTEYLKFYNSLINDERLLTKMEELGYNGVFYNHPNFRQQYDDYIQNDLIKVSKENADAIDVISNCAMLITDYSSAFFECAYLNKPVVYTQFDSDTFVERHTGGEGYFNYETDSFGPICYDLKSSVDAIIYYMENGCKNDKIYEDRINEFFVYRDKLNSKRLVDEIVKLDEIKKEG